MIIAAKGEVTYADILWKFRVGPDQKYLSEEKILTSLVGCAEIKTRREEKVIKCKDMVDIALK